MKRKLIVVIKALFLLYIALCVGLYFFQEHLIFFPQKLDRTHEFYFTEDFEEFTFRTSDGVFLNGLLFKSDSSKGLIFYLHGNAGSLSSWGNVSSAYLALHYDVFILDYRGYGKSEGTISSQNQLFQDNQMIYDVLKKKYQEKDIIILGYSIGTGLASKLASDNSPRKLILQAPYYSLTDMMRQRFSLISTFILKYKFATNEYLKNCKMPIVIFHGDRDDVIHNDASLRLKAQFNNSIKLVILKGQGHNGMTENKAYKQELRKVL